MDLAQAASQSPPPVTPSEVARLLVGEGSVVKLATEERVRRSIAMDAPTFALPGGASSVMLLQLPDYSGPYDLTVVSFRRGIGLTTEIFVPSGFYFDAEFQQVGAFGEEQLEVRRQSLLNTSGTADGLVAVKGGVKLDHRGGGKVDQFTGGWGFGLRDLRGRLERRPATPVGRRV